MPCDYRDYPKEWRGVSRYIRDVRSGKRCERCGVRQYGIGHWKGGEFEYVKGNEYYDRFMYAESYREARETAEHLNEWCDQEPKVIVIVLTVAHQCECKPLCAEYSHLLGLCQRCHNMQDAPMRARHAARTRQVKKEKAGQLNIFPRL